MPARAFLRRHGSKSAANRHAPANSPRESGTVSIRTQLAVARAEVTQLTARCDEAESEIRRLHEAVRARDTFIAIASFELRNPMAAIALGVGNLLFQAARDSGLPAWIGERLESLDRRTRSFVRRSTTLLDISRLASGQLGIHREAANLGLVVRAAASELAPEAARAACEMRLAIDADVTGAWDRSALEQVALHLLSNAIRFGAGAPVDVTVTRTRTSTRDGESDAALFIVRDRGPGIGDADRARIFETFERAIAARECAGFGLGLWITRQLVRAHGGELGVTVGAGAGSEFTVTLPREPRDESRPRE